MSFSTAFSSAFDSVATVTTASPVVVAGVIKFSSTSSIKALPDILSIVFDGDLRIKVVQSVTVDGVLTVASRGSDLCGACFG